MQPSRTTLQEYFPALLRREEKEVRRLLGTCPVTIIFDGMTRQGELFVIVIRFVTDKLEIEQKLVTLKTLEKSLTALQMAAEISHELRTQLMLQRDDLERLVCAVHDRAAVNILAIKLLVCNVLCSGLVCYANGGMPRLLWCAHANSLRTRTCPYRRRWSRLRRAALTCRASLISSTSSARS